MNNPIIIGGVGGSGTKVVAMICEKAGVDFGIGINEFYDKVLFESFINSNLKRLFVDKVPYQVKDEFIQLFKKSDFKDFNKRWGWKNGMNMFYLPIYKEIFPEMKYIHVVRDGRDMAYSANQLFATLMTPICFGKEWKSLRTPEINILLWSRFNELVHVVYGTFVGKSYFIIRFEDLCKRPKEVIGQLLGYLEIDAKISELAELVKPPDSLDRWRKLSQEQISRLRFWGREGLKLFEYI